VNQVVSPMIDLMGHTSNVRLQYRRWLNVEDSSKDKGIILVDGQQRWINTATGNDHTDREWRFHDVDLSADAADGKVQVTFQLSSDASTNLGGWNVDDFCIVAAHVTTSEPVCGNGTVEAGEECDDNNTTSGDGCSAVCQTELPPGVVCGNSMVEQGEDCDDGNTMGGDGCSASCQNEDTTEPVCGNGVVEGAEQCDDGNADDTDACKTDCTNGDGNPVDPPGNADGGCGCNVGGRGGATGGAATLLIGALGALWFVRRRRSNARVR
jgi:MYXO-CTERM domain-containing protein